MRNSKILVSISGSFAGFTAFMIAVYIFKVSSLLDNRIYQIFIKLPVFVALIYLLVNTVINSDSRYIFRYKFSSTIIFMFLYSMARLYSDYRASVLNWNSVMSTIISLLLFLSLSVAGQKGHLTAVIRGLLVYFLLICGTNDLIWVSKGFRPLVEGNLRINLLPQFFIGNKFAVMYDHIFLAALFLMLYRGKSRRNWSVFLGIMLIILSFSFDCSTTVVASFAFMIMLLLEGRKNSLFENRTTISAALAASAVFPFLSHVIMSLGLIQNIVTGLLGRNISLSGRVNIFTSIIILVTQNPFWGKGKGEAASAITYVSGAANIQNGLWQIVITYGMIGAVLLVSIVISSVRPLRKNDVGIHRYTALILIYTFILIGFVEITYDSILLTAIAIYNSLGEGKEKS